MKTIQPIPESLLRHVPAETRGEVLRWWKRLSAARRAVAMHLAPASPRPKLDPISDAMILGEPDEAPEEFPDEDDYEYRVAHELMA